MLVAALSRSGDGTPEADGAMSRHSTHGRTCFHGAFAMILGIFDADSGKIEGSNPGLRPQSGDPPDNSNASYRKTYWEACYRGSVRLGVIWMAKTLNLVKNPFAGEPCRAKIHNFQA